MSGISSGWFLSRLGFCWELRQGREVSAIWLNGRAGCWRYSSISKKASSDRRWSEAERRGMNRSFRLHGSEKEPVFPCRKGVTACSAGPMRPCWRSRDSHEFGKPDFAAKRLDFAALLRSLGMCGCVGGTREEKKYRARVGLCPRKGPS